MPLMDFEGLGYKARVSLVLPTNLFADMHFDEI
jgi:hypothetical protein